MKKNQLFVLGIILVLLIAALPDVTGCTSSAPAPAPAPSPGTAPSTTPASELPPVKIGLLYPLTGPTALVGEFMVEASKFAFEEAGYQAAGRKIEVIIEDEAAQPAMAIDKSRKLIEHDKVDMIIGPLTSVANEAVAPVISKAGIPQISPSPNDLKLTEYDWYFLVGGSKRQMVYPMGLYAYDKLGFRKVTVLSEDTVTGRTFVGAYIEAFKLRGGEVIQEQYAPFACNDYAPYLINLKDADAVVAWFQGADSVRFHMQFHEFGIRQRMPLQPAYFGGFIQPFLLRKLPPPVADAMVGEYSLALYTYLLETEASKRFTEVFKNKYGYKPDDVHATPYLGVEVALKALEASRGDTAPNRLREALLSLDFQSAEGRIRFDPQTKCAIRDTYICQLEKRDGDYVMVPIYTYENVPPGGL